MRELQYRITYIDRDGDECGYRVSESKKDAALASFAAKGIKVARVEKLYPMNTEKVQHNFALIHDASFNRMSDMRNGEIPMDDAEYDRLSRLFNLSGDLMLLDLPVAWLTGNELAEARMVSAMAVEHRMGACINAGRMDLLQYC